MNHFEIKDRSACEKKKSTIIRNKNISQELNIFCPFPTCKIHLQDLIQDTMKSFSHTVFRLTFKGTSIAQDRKLANSMVAISINNTISIASYSFHCSLQHAKAINFTSSKFASFNDVIETV